MPGIVSISPAPAVTGVNTTASIASYGPNALTFTFSAPKGLTILPFLFNTEQSFYPANSSGQGFNAQQVEEAIKSGNYASSISVSAPQGTYEQPIPLLGGVEPETGKVVDVTNAYPNGMQLPNSLLNTKGISIEQYFQKECNTDATFTEGAYKGKTLAQVLGVSKADLTPEACDAVFHKNIDLTVSFGGKSYSFTNPKQVEELINAFEINIPSTNFTGYNGPGIEGPMQIHASLSGMAVYFLGLYFGDTQEGATFSPTINLWPSTQNGGLYSPSGANIQVSSTVEGKAETSYTYTYQLFGNSYSNFYSSSVAASDLTSNGLISSSASAGPLGLYFNAVSQTGQPLTQVQIALQFEGATGNGLSGYGGDYIWPAYWNPSNVNDANVGYNYPYNGPDSLDLSSSSYQYYGWSVSANTVPSGSLNTESNYSPVMFTAYSIPGHPGCFALSGLPAGTYNVTVGGEAQGYYLPTFSVTLGPSYSSPETFESYIDPDGFIDASTDTIVTNSILPNTYFLYTDGKAAYNASTGNTPSLSQSVGSDNPFDYQLSTYLSYGPFTLLLNSWQGYNLNLSDMKIAGIPLSTLQSHGASLSKESLTLNSSAISYIEQNGYLPATPSQAGGTSKIALSSGLYNRTLSITIPTYITPDFSEGDEVILTLTYKGTATNGGQTISDGNFPAATTNGPANNSVPSTLTTSAPSSSTGLWFKSLNADGSASKGAKFLIQNSSGQYLEEDTSSSGAFSGWSWTSSPSSALEFSQRNADAVFSFGGLADGTYTVTQVAWPDSVGKSVSSRYTGEQNWPGVSPDLTGNGDPEWAGYPGHLNGNAGYNGSFQVTLSYSSPEAMTTQADPAGLVDSSKDSIYAFAPVKMAPMNGNSLSTQSYQTETVGVPFTEGWEGYLPMAVTSPSSTSGQNGYASELTVSFPEKDSGLDNNGNSSGLEMSNPSTSNISVAGVPLSTLVSNGASVSTSNSYYSVSLPYQALEYLEDNGKNAAGDSLSSSSNRLVIISFPAVMGTSFKNGGQFQQWMALGSGWWNQNAGSGWGVYSSPLYTNGPADNSVPSSLSPSENSSKTGIWFKSLWYGTTTPATGAKFTVQNSSGKYLTPITNSSGSFEGWSYSKTAYDFEEQNSSAVFSFGGLTDGTYTVSEVSPASGATSSSMSFTGELSYSSPQTLTSLSDPMDLLSLKDAVVYNVAIPSHLPETGGRGILVISITVSLLFLAGAITLFLLKKVKKRGEKR
ncbi:MAG: hypothetical protein IIZ01_01455 [Aeriscardovia sp.]|nr:hypothetical protein [Aeriscardovia sp.]